ncbi:zinc-dependent metalloprotease [Rhodocaloribacter litoris]|uniref:zinc-dependent metalloprotease n=1 Tax=Rhodocaloribacter litoris TaxID=2558931 RepID=UPI00142444AA|nr:zinc-dependent metalloprotease [Rhodocaloribacter litoris]
MATFRTLAVLALVAGLLAGCAGTKPATQPAAQPAQARQEQQKKGKSYRDVITEEARSDEGLFTVHRIEEKLYYEIPDSLLERELLLVTRYARTENNIGYGGMKANTQVVRWQKQGKKILLRVVSYENVADENEPIYQAVRNSNFEPIIAAFDIETMNDDSTAYVVEVTNLFTDDVPSLGLPKERRDQFKVRRLDKSRSYIVSARSYPKNIEVRHVLTYEATDSPSNTGALSLEMNQSMIVLPEDKMQPRLCDERVGFFSVRMTDYGRDEQKAAERCYITRWRLEPSDPEAWARGELVEPKKPIVYYIDPATPMKWRPYLKQGVEDWNEAFAAAGFKNAIIAKDPPSPEEDPEFSPEDVRYSVIRYFSSPIQNAFGPHVHDPRTGEILESDIGWYHNVMNLLRNWYFVQTAAVNPEAQRVKFEDEVMGELIRFVSAHEVGHTLGLPHNWGSSYAYPVDSLRSPTFTATHGTAPSIMDYARFNYIAQPGDGVTNFMPRIGEYDKWAIEWGYRPIPEARTPDEERPVLNRWVVERADDPRYFYGRQSGARIDPRAQNEDLGDDAVKASTYGLANLKRIVPNLIAWTEENGKNYDDLEELYEQVVAQWNRYAGHVARNIGGVYETYKTYDQEGAVYEPVPAARQREAMAFLNREVFATPSWLLDTGVLRRIEHAGAVERVRRLQVGVVELVLDPQRLARMIEAEALPGGDPYPCLEMLTDLRRGIWRELERGEAIDPYRRNLQRGYLERLEYLMTEEVTPPPAAFREFVGFTPVKVSQSDIRALARGELQALRGEVQRARSRTTDRMTRLHLDDVLARIDDILEADRE